MLYAKMKRIVVVGIAGPSGSGKSSLAERIVSVLSHTAVLAMDNYLDSTRQVINENFDDSRLIDFELLRKNIQDIMAGRPAETPLYDFRRSGRYAYKTIEPPASNVLIVEGTYALHQELRSLLDLRISVSGGVHNDLIKRIMRDINRTGQDPHQAISQITETVYPMYKAFIEPDLLTAHIRIANKFNPFTAIIHPQYILKSEKCVDEALIKETLPSAEVFDEKSYDIYLHPPDRRPEGCRDWIRVRNIAGQYSVMFSEDIKEGGFIVSPRIDFTVSVKILGGLMALGYKIGAIINRTSRSYRAKGDAAQVAISVEKLDQLGQTFTMVKGTDRQKVQDVAAKLGLTGGFIDKTFIELYQERFPTVPAPKL
eukprot:TRINITY_DN639_c0_g1_i1.p1 TRINITY_DN639_c0_g1~~TRINITY_DN639_c0_g1_i1.p1  ORF type:complete len:369 (+),score=92.55 TRINITY_DN639_c0_g1_i1:224-1330(+)